MKKPNHYISEFPLLVADWNWEKNIKCTPETTASGSQKKVWWKCNVCGFEWEAQPNSRSRGCGCPKCGKQKSIATRVASHITKVGSLASLFPNLLDEWYYKRNNVTPESISAQSNKKVWWKCKICGTEWQAIVQSRTKGGTGCPKCGKDLGNKNKEKNKLLKIGSLVETHPYLIKEWDFESNEINPNDITSCYSQKVHWLCIKGHQWQAPVNIRARLGTGCPICAKEGGTSFAEQAIYYYINSIIPSVSRYLHKGIEIDVYIPSLNVGIEYDGLFFHKSSKSIAKEKKKNDALSNDGIRVIRIKESSEIKLVGDTIYTIYSNDYDYLKEVITNVMNLLSINIIPDVNINRDRIRILEQYIINEKVNSIATKFPEIAAQWDYQRNGRIKPEFIRSSSNQKFWWKCSKGHYWEAAVYSRANGNGCPFCSGKILVVGENDLLSQNPKLAGEWNYRKNGNLKPDQITIRNGKKVWWICPTCGKEYFTTVAHRSEGKGCPVCGRKKSDASRNLSVLKRSGSFVDAKPELLDEWDFKNNGILNPLMLSKSSGKKVWWVCKKCGYNWEALISNRVRLGSGCPICKKKLLSANNKRTALKKTGSISQTHPYLLQEWDYNKNAISPESISIGSSQKVWWKCRFCGYEWESAPNSSNRRLGFQKGCPVCQRKKVLVGRNDLSTTNPKIASEWNYSKNGNLKPTMMTDGCNKKVWWLCSTCGTEWEASIIKRSKGQCNCPKCKKDLQ